MSSIMTLRDIRERIILMVAFGSGSRRRSEIACLRTEQLTEEAPIPVENGPPLPSLSIHLDALPIIAYVIH